MYTKYNIKRADRLHVIQGRKGLSSRYLWFRVDSSKTMHTVSFNPKISFLKAFDCDCYWFANKTLYGDKYCAHILSVIKQKLVLNNMDAREFWRLVEDANEENY